MQLAFRMRVGRCDKKMVILALECSTSAAKALVYDTEGRRQWLCSENFDTSVADAFTQDMDAAYSTLIRCGRGAVAAASLTCDTVVLVSTWHSLLLCDKAGLPVGRIRLWSDLEGAEFTGRIARDAELKRRIYERTGCILHATYPVWKYHYLRENGLVPDGLSVYSQGEYLFRRMTGVRAVSLNIASGSGMLNLHTLRWDEEMLKFAGIKEECLGRLCGEDHSEPLTAEPAGLLGLKQGTPVYVGGADGAMTQLGCDALGERRMTVSVGTSGALRTAYPQPVFSPSLSTWCYYLTSGKYLAGAATNGAGNCVNLLVAQCGKPVKELDSMLAGRDSSGAPVFLPFIFGERCPGWSESPYGGFSAGSQELADRYYAVLEGVLFNLYQCYEDLAAAGGVPDEIRVSGGIVNSPVWLQMCADIFGRQIQAAEMQHASLLGGVVLAAQANGEDIGKDVWNPHKTVRPNDARSVFYKTRYQKYLDYYRKKRI